jgi:hypothetical protein
LSERLWYHKSFKTCQITSKWKWKSIYLLKRAA